MISFLTLPFPYHWGMYCRIFVRDGLNMRKWKDQNTLNEMKIRIWVKCAPNPTTAKHPSFFFSQWDNTKAYRLKRRAAQARSLFSWLSQRRNLTDTMAKAALRHRGDSKRSHRRRRHIAKGERKLRVKQFLHHQTNNNSYAP